VTSTTTKQVVEANGKGGAEHKPRKKRQIKPKREALLIKPTNGKS